MKVRFNEVTDQWVASELFDEESSNMHFRNIDTKVELTLGEERQFARCRYG